MGPLVVVDLHGLTDHVPGKRKAGQGFPKAELVLEDAVDALGHGVLVGVVLLGGAKDHPVLEGELGELWAAVLDAPVAVVDDVLPSELGVPPGHPQGALDQVRPHVGFHAPAHDLLGVGIGDQGQVGVLPIEPEVGDVADPDLLAAVDLQPLEPVGGGVEEVLGVGGDVVALGPLHQHSPGPQEGNEGVPAHLDAVLGERLSQLAVELAGPQGGHPLPDGFYQAQDDDGLCLLLPVGVEPLVVSLLRYPKTLIEPLHFVRLRFFRSISFTNVLGKYFFASSSPVSTSKSAITSCWNSLTNSSSSMRSRSRLISSFLLMRFDFCSKELNFFIQ